jgi:hypothetical protein
MGELVREAILRKRNWGDYAGRNCYNATSHEADRCGESSVPKT